MFISKFGKPQKILKWFCTKNRYNFIGWTAFGVAVGTGVFAVVQAIRDNPYSSTDGLNALEAHNVSYIPVFLCAVLAASLAWTWLRLDSFQPQYERDGSSGGLGVVRAFENYGSKSTPSTVDPRIVWVGALYQLRESIDELKGLQAKMKGGQAARIKAATRAAKDLLSHTKATFRYLEPAFIPGANTNPALDRATGEMVRDVRLLPGLVGACAQLYVQSLTSSGHTEIIGREIDSVIAQVNAINEIDDLALKAGT
jgi:hypothetical protein